MFSTSRRWTASSSAIKMVAVMAFPARYNYLYQIGALWPMAINALLRFVARRHAFVDAVWPTNCIDRFRSDMASRSSALRKSSAQRKSAVRKPRPQRKARTRPANLPEWNLADLYSGIDAPEVTRDLDRIDADCNAFEPDYKGKLAEETAKPDGGGVACGSRATL